MRQSGPYCLCSVPDGHYRSPWISWCSQRMACWPETGQSQTLWTGAAVPPSVPSLHVEAVRIDAVVLFSLLVLPTLFLLVAMCSLLLSLFILFCLFFFKLFRMSCLTLPRVSRVDKPGLHSIKWSGDWWHPSPSCVTLVGLSVTDGAKSATSLRPLSKGSKLMNWEANDVKYFGICTTNGLSPIKQRMEEIARSMPAS